MMLFRRCYRKVGVLTLERLGGKENLQLEVQRARRLLWWSRHGVRRAHTPVASA